MKPSYLWVIVLAGAWPVLAFGLRLAHEGRLPQDAVALASEVLGYLRVGLYSGVALILLMRRALSRRAGLGALAGYAFAVPVAYAFGRFGPVSVQWLASFHLPRVITDLVLVPLAIGFWGALPLILGAALGRRLGD